MKKIIILILVSLSFVAILLSPFFIKVKIICESQFGPCPDELNSKLQAFNSKSLFSAKKGTTKILKADFLVSDFSLQYKLPDILTINLLIKKPEFAMVNKNTGDTALIDKDGQVLSISKNTTLPRVLVSTNLPKPGENIGQTNLKAMKLIEGVFEMYQVAIGAVDNTSLTVDIPGQVRVIFPLDQDTQVLLGSLRLVYTKISAGNLAGKYSQIDLRYKNPVLR